MARTPLPLLLACTAAGLLALAFSPPAAIVLSGALVVGGAVLRSRGSRVTGAALLATGGALYLAAVLVLVVVDAGQDEPVIIGPDTGLVPSG